MHKFIFTKTLRIRSSRLEVVKGSWATSINILKKTIISYTANFINSVQYPC